MQIQNINHNNIDEIHALDDFDYNIIDLSSSDFWKLDENNLESFYYSSDFYHLERAINNSKSEILIVLPQNIDLEDNFNYETIETKNMLSAIMEIINTITSFDNIYLAYEKTTFSKKNKTFFADFHFLQDKNYSQVYYNGVNFDIDIESNDKYKSNKSNKTVIIKYKNLSLTTLDINKENYMDFISFLYNLNYEVPIPEWSKKVEILDYKHIQTEINNIEKEELILKNKKKELSIRKELLDEYRSILYTGGNTLEVAVRKIIGEILDYDVSVFQDKGNEDLLIELPNIRFLFEIKGVEKNLERKYLAQLLTYETEYDKCQVKKTKSILIINHNKSKELEQREELNQDNLKYAIKYNQLVITTEQLLKLLNLPSSKKDYIISLLDQSVGQLDF